jgi:hypothetical protein
MHGMVAIADRAQTIPSTPAPRARGQRGRSGWRQNFRGNPSDKRPFQRPSPSQQSRLGSCSRDPVGYEGSEWNLYEYVGGRPTVAMDPSGRFDVLVPGSDPLMPGNQSDVYFPIVTPDDKAALATCSKINFGLVPCAGCTAEKCREAVLEFINAKNESWLIGIPFVGPLGTNTCGRQADDIVGRVPNLEDNPCVAMVGVMVENVSEGAWHPTRQPSHAYAKMMLCDGQTINADNGAWGGPDRIWVGPRR